MAQERQTLAQMVRAKYPGAYDDLDDAALEAAVKAKYPGVYDDLPTTGAQDAPATPTPAAGASRPVTLPGQLWDVAKGLGKGVASTAIGGAELVNKGLSAVGLVDPIKPEVFDAARQEFATPETTAQKVGFGVEQLGEFLVPFSTGAKLASKMPAAWRAARGLSKAAGEAAEFGGKAALQSGGDAEDVVAASMLGAASPALTKTFQAAGKAFTRVLPEKLYGQVFKLADDDLRLAYESEAKGQPLNPTLAREVLDRGLMGSSRNMAVYSIKKLDALEQQVKQTVSQAQPITLPRKSDIINVLNGIKKDFGKGFFTDRAVKADELAKALKRMPGDHVQMADALAVRRFLDRMRNTSSFRLDPKLTAKQEELKGAADLIRSTLRQNPKLADLMNEERVFIQALDHIIEDAARRNRREFINLTDMILGGGGMATGGPFGAAVGVGAVRGLKLPFMLTHIGQGLNKLGSAAPPAEPVARAVTGAAASAGGR